MAEIRINATGGVKLYDADDSHYAQILAGTITANTDVMTLGHAAVVMGTKLDLNGNNLILDADADTYLDGGTVDDVVDVYVAGAKDWKFGANSINVLSGTTLTIDSGATITNSGTATGFGALDGIDDQTSSNDDQLTITDSEVCINEDSDDLDFRVEGNGDPNLMIVDGGADNVSFSRGSAATDQAIVHISRGGYNPGSQGKHALMVGADQGDANTMTNSTRKQGSIVGPHYTNAEEPITFMRMDSDNGSSVLHIGGTPETNSTEKIIFFMRSIFVIMS